MIKKILCIMCGISLVLLGIGCQPKKKDTKNSVPLVIVSIPPYIHLVQKIAGDTVKVASAIPPGYNPHITEITPREVQLLQDADLWIGVGAAFETPLLRSLKDSDKTTYMLQINEVIPLLSPSKDTHDIGSCKHHSHEGEDLHFWMSPKRLKVQADFIARALVRVSPENADLYTVNLQKLFLELDTLDKEITSLLEPFKKKAILVSHAAFGYFCYDYDLVQLAVECEGKSPLPKDLDRVINSAKNYDIQCAFILPQFDNRGALLIADQLHLDVYTIDDLSENIFENLEKIALLIAKKNNE